MSENIKVAVRVRPFNQREVNRNAKLIVQMKDDSTYLRDPGNPSAEPKRFTFDYSYWSHDGFDERSGYFQPTSPKYADQQKVFKDLGESVLDNAWKGYNCTLFAYGQTGAGKSYSMIGFGANKGIVPVSCEELFKRVNTNQTPDSQYQISVSMLEIYNEQVQDLLSKDPMPTGGMKIRQHPTKGFYVEGLTSAVVRSHLEVEDYLVEGTKNRTIAATNMNATSSRAHTIFTIHFMHKSKAQNGEIMAKTSVIHLVDLAGSERAKSTGATGDRLAEGVAINRSLSTLGNVIRALVDNSNGKKISVPFRDSVLTKLLKNALGGNSKTVLIAAISPADVNYDETLSTLRFAEQVKRVQTRALVNETSTESLIKKLKEENSRLQEMLKNKSNELMKDPSDANKEELIRVKKKMEEQLAENMAANQREIEELQKSWKQKYDESQRMIKEKEEQEKRKKKRQRTTPHLWNLHEDPQLTHVVVHLLHKGSSMLGREKDITKTNTAIVLNGLSIRPQHATIVNHENNVVTLTPSKGAKILVNGHTVTDSITLHHNDRILFGTNHLYVIHHPKELEALLSSGKHPTEITYLQAQEEIAATSGFDMSTEGKGKEELELQEELVSLMPMVYEANSISEELNKQVCFEIALISPQLRGLKEGKTEVMVKLQSLVGDNMWLWPVTKFLERRYQMLDMYHKYVQEEEWEVPYELDPFCELEDDVLIGQVRVYMTSLSYNIEMEDTLNILDYKGQKHGNVSVELRPCLPDGSLPSEEEDPFVDEPKELLGQEVNFLIMILKADGLSEQPGEGIYCKCHFYLDSKELQTETVPFTTGTGSVDINFSHHVKVRTVTQQFLDYLTDQPLVIEVRRSKIKKEEEITDEEQLTIEDIESEQDNETVSEDRKGPNPLAMLFAASAAKVMAAKARKRIANRAQEAMAEETKQNSRVGSAVTISGGINDKTMNEVAMLKSELSTQKNKTERLEKKLAKVRELLETAQKDEKNHISVEELNEVMFDRRGSTRIIPNMMLARLAMQSAARRNTVTNSQACSVM